MTQSVSFRQLGADIDQALRSDRPRFRKRLRAIEEASGAGRPFDRNLGQLTADVERSVAIRKQRVESAPQPTFDEALPITAKRAEIAAALAEHQVIVVCGETGSGKSTQLPKICLEMGRGLDGLIGHTQPRRIAARSVAARIAEELQTPLGQGVGFKIRFTDATSPQSYIKLMTDGILLAESQRDRFLDQYDTIIIDEAHERSLNIDFLLGYLRRLLPRRPDLKLIITSATIDPLRFSEHFASTRGPAPIVEVSGRTYPVEVLYRPLADDDDREDPDWQRAVVAAVDELAAIDNGDILIFMPTERDIHETAKILRGHTLRGDLSGRTTEIFPLYARLSGGEQNKVFAAHSYRRIVIATNVAESSLTVPGIRYVIDPGTARISRYSPRSKVQRLPIEAISQASADQRKGRCGRVGPGICIRLFSEADFNSRERFTLPEIQRTNLAAVILQAKSLHFGEIEEFPFLDPPRPEMIRDGYKTLFELGAIDDKNELTPLGKQLSRIPADPRIGRIILAGHDESCLHEVLIIASGLETQDPRERPVDKQQAADAAHAQFTHAESDFLSYLKLWDFYQGLKNRLSRNQLRKACKQNFLSYNRMQEWTDLHRQLAEIVDQTGLKSHPRRDDYNAIHRALLSGLLSNVAFRADAHEYTLAGGNKGHLWPGSALFAKKPKWIVAAEVVETTRRYLRTAARIDPGWIESLAGHLVSRSYSEPHWDRASGSCLAFEKVSLFGLVVVPRRRVRYGPIDPVKSRELLIQHGLVEGEFDTKGAFLAHNQNLIAELDRLQAKSRRHDLLRGDETRFEFYDKRLPEDAYDGPRFEKWRKATEQDNPRVLYMSEADLLQPENEPPSRADFPDTLKVQQLNIPLSYRFDPGEAEDGITITVPREGLNQIDSDRLGWLVPGLLEQKIVALIKSLPKSLRRAFVPATDTARQVFAELKPGQGSFEGAVAAILSRLAGEPIPASAFQGAELPDHLRMNVRVVDEEGKQLAAGRDLSALRREFGAEASASFSENASPEWNRDGLVEWNFGDLPEQIAVKRGGLALAGFPALLDRGDSVSLRLLDVREQALAETRLGVRRLCCLAAARELKAQVDWLPEIDKLSLIATTLEGAQVFRRQLVELLAERAFLSDGVLPRSAVEFKQFFTRGKNRVSVAVQDVGAVVGPLMQSFQEVRLALDRSQKPLWLTVTADMQAQLAELCTPGFLNHTPWPWLQQFPRYLRAMQVRLEKLGRGGLARDRQHQQTIEPHWRRYLERIRQDRNTNRQDPELAEYHYMIEEFRVSLFAQELRTSISISAKRLEKQWEKVHQHGNP